MFFSSRDDRLARFSIVTRGREILRSHSDGVRFSMAAALEKRGVTVVTGHEALEVVSASSAAGKRALRCRLKSGGAADLPFDECIWCTEAAAAPRESAAQQTFFYCWEEADFGERRACLSLSLSLDSCARPRRSFLAESGLACDAYGFLRVDSRQRCGVAAFAGGVVSRREDLRVFSAGDCASVDGHPRPKAGVFAVMAGMALYTNIVAELEGSDGLDHLPQTSFLGLLSTGDGEAVASRGQRAA